MAGFCSLGRGPGRLLASTQQPRRRYRAVLLWVAVVLVPVVLFPVAAEAQTPGLEIVYPEELTLTLEEGGSSEATVWVRNTTDQEADPVFEASLEDSEGDALEPVVMLVDDAGNAINARSLPAGSVGRYRLVLRPAPKTTLDDASGLLVVRGAGAPGTIPITVGEEKFADVGVTGVLLWPLLPAGLLIIGAGVLATRGNMTGLLSPLPPDLDFKTSFASTATAAGAVLATVIAAGVLPEETVTLSKEAFVALNLIFGIAVVVAGLVYAALQWPVWVDLEKKNPADPVTQQRKMQASVLGFLVASLVTVWAVLGELWTVWLMLDALGDDQGFSDTALWVFRTLILVAFAMMLPYTIIRIPAIVSSERRKPHKVKARTPTLDETRVVSQRAEPAKSVPLL